MGTATGENHQCTRWCAPSHVPLATSPPRLISRLCCAHGGIDAADARVAHGLEYTTSRVRSLGAWRLRNQSLRDSRVPPSEPPFHTRMRVDRCVHEGNASAWTERDCLAGRSCVISPVMGNLFQCQGTGQLHVCDSTCVQRVQYDNVSTICRLSRRVFPISEQERAALQPM